MCNPRRVRVRASSRLARMWQEELSRTGRASAEVAGEATLLQPFGTLLGAAARRAFEAALGADTRWTWQDGVYLLDTENGSVAYHLDSGEIEMTTRLRDVVTAEAEVTRTVKGTFVVETEAERSERYYDDGWGDLTKSVAERTARQEAQEQADREAAQQAARREERERLDGRRTLTAQQDAVTAEAREEAERRLAAPAQQRREELSLDAAARLEEERTDFLRPVHEVLAVAYRDAIVEYARAHGADGLQVDEKDGVLNIQFEMEA